MTFPALKKLTETRLPEDENICNIISNSTNCVVFTHNNHVQCTKWDEQIINIYTSKYCKSISVYGQMYIFTFDIYFEAYIEDIS